MARIIGIILFVFSKTLSVESELNKSALPMHAVKCSNKHPEYKAAKEQFASEFNKLVSSSFTTDDNTPVDITAFNNSAMNLLDVANSSCKNGGLDSKWSYYNFMDFVQFSLKNVTLLKELHNTGAFNCMVNQQKAVKDCVNASGVGNWKPGNYMNKAHLNFELYTTCEDTKIIRQSIINLFNANHCTKLIVDYVDSLFNYTLHKYCKAEPVKNDKSCADKVTGLLTAFSMFSILSGIEL